MRVLRDCADAPEIAENATSPIETATSVQYKRENPVAKGAETVFMVDDGIKHVDALNIQGPVCKTLSSLAYGKELIMLLLGTSAIVDVAFHATLSQEKMRTS